MLSIWEVEMHLTVILLSKHKLIHEGEENRLLVKDISLMDEDALLVFGMFITV